MESQARWNAAIWVRGVGKLNCPRGMYIYLKMFEHKHKPLSIARRKRRERKVVR
jgi:hypothetical protein